MSKYETYKPSGIDWIGDVPSIWEVKRLKDFTLKILGGGTPTTGIERYWDDEKTTGIPWVAIADITKAEIIVDTDKFITQEGLAASSTQLIEKGKILYSIYASLGKVAIAGRELATNQAILSIYENPVLSNVNFLKYCLKGIEDIVGGIGSSTTQNNISLEKLRTIKFPLPSPSEQLAIANYLDNQTQKIDRLISNKKAQAEKLKELRQIEINNAVTKGLNPNAEMKDSGINWLGSINKEYKLDTFKRVCKLKQGLQIDQELRFFETGINRLPYITIKAINAGVDAENIEYIENADEGVICTPDEILLARTGATGEVVTGLHGVFHNNFFKIIYNRTLLDKDFLVFYLNNSAIKSYLLLLAGTTTIPDLNHRAFFSAPIVLPLISEQIQIANYLKNRTKSFDTLIENIENQIQQLQELRKIKIYEAVTGKIKVNAYVEATA